MKVLLQPAVKAYLNSLVAILYINDYFGFEASAVCYVEELVDDITANLPKHSHKPAPPHFDQYGKNMYYTAFKKNKQTTWYTFFTKYNDNGETIYLVRYIANNHTVAQYL